MNSPVRTISSLARHGWLTLAVVVGAVGLLSSCQTKDHSGVQAPQTPAAPAAPVGPPGAVVYANSCARCHGSTRQGTGKAEGLDPVKMASVSDQQLRLNIQTGKGKMPAFGRLTTAQVDDLVAYLKGY